VDPRGGAPPLVKLRKRPEFLFVAQGVKAGRATLVIQARMRTPPRSAIGMGFTATRKIGGAVVRNRAKRRLRAVAAALLPKLGRPGADYVFVARADTGVCGWDRLLDDARSALHTLSAALLAPREGRHDRAAASPPAAPE
jgi:ribonuclease P protein component